MSRKGPQNFSKLGGFFFIASAAGLEMGLRAAKRAFPLHKVTAYLLDKDQLNSDFSQLKTNLDLKNAHKIQKNESKDLKNIIENFEKIEANFLITKTNRELETFKKYSLLSNYNNYEKLLK